MNLKTKKFETSTGFKHFAKLLFPTWKELKGTAGSDYARLAILVPIVGYFIILNENVMKYIEDEGYISSGLIPILSGPRPKMYLLYYGLFLIGASSFMFNLFKPKTMNFSLDEYEYINHEQETINSSSELYRRYVIRMKEEVKHSYYARKMPLCKLRLISRRLSGIYIRVLRFAHKENRSLELGRARSGIDSDILWDYYNLMSHHAPIKRALIRIIFSTGLIISLIPAIDTFANISANLITNVYGRYIKKPYQEEFFLVLNIRRISIANL